MRIIVGGIVILFGVCWFIYHANRMFKGSCRYDQLLEDFVTSSLSITFGVLVILDKISL